MSLRSRRGYWAPNATEVEKARTEAAAADAIPGDVTGALAVLSAARADRMFDLWVGAERGVDGQSAITVAWTPRTAARRVDPQQTMSVVVKDADGDRSFEASLSDGTLSLPSPPGPVQLRVTARDAAGNILDEDRRPFVVPDLSSENLAFGVPALLRAHTVVEARALADGQPASPYAGCEFGRTDRVFVRVSLYGAAAGDAEVSARLTNKADSTLLEIPATRVPSSLTTYQVDLPLASIARGDYLIAIAATHGEERIRALVPIRVTPL